MRNSSLILWLRTTHPHVCASNRRTCSSVVHRRKMHRAMTIYPQFVLISPPTLTNENPSYLSGTSPHITLLRSTVTKNKLLMHRQRILVTRGSLMALRKKFPLFGAHKSKVDVSDSVKRWQHGGVSGRCCSRPEELR